jgi:hypothetical protein
LIVTVKERANRVQVRRTPLGFQILMLQTLVKVRSALVLSPSYVPDKVDLAQRRIMYTILLL